MSGIIVFLALKWLNSRVEFLTSFEARVDAVSSALSTFAFTMIGFLATVISVLFGLADRAAIQRYAKKGHLHELMFFCLLTVLTHMGTYLASLGLLARPSMMLIAITGAVVNLLQLALISLVGYNLCNRAFTETPA